MTGKTRLQGVKKPIMDDEWDAALSRKKKLGRPEKLANPKTRNRLIRLLARGLPIIHACHGAGITPPVFYLYREKHADFREEVERAVAVAIEKRLRIIEKAADNGSPAQAQWLLEHLHPEHFARNRIELSGPDGGPLTAGVGIYLPKKDNGDEAVIEVTPANQIESRSTTS